MTRPAEQEKQGYCTLCRSRCGTINVVQGDALVSVRPDPSHPTGAAMCTKGRAAPELVHSPHRVLYPMRRTNPKSHADPGWQRISWDEALSTIAARMGTYRTESGAESVAFSVTTPSGTPLSDSIEWIERFVRVFGSPNICYATEICNWHKDVAHEFTFGCGIPVADYSRADLVMLWGHNPTATWLAQADAIARGRARGAKLLVIDPRPTPLAQQADCWLRVRPGTDAAVALGLMRLLIEGGRWDDPFVREWTNAPMLVRADTGRLLREPDLVPGAPSNHFLVWDAARQEAVPYDTARAAGAQSAAFALRGEFELTTVLPDGATSLVRCSPAFELLARACDAYTPEAVAAISGVDPEALRHAADLLAANPRVAYHAWSGVGQHTNATQTERSIATLYALLGCFDEEGGNRQFGKPPHRAVNALDLLAPGQRAKALGLAQRPLGPPAQGWVTARDLYRAITHGQPYRVRALVSFGTNLLVSQSDTGLGQEALAALEFHVHCDPFETPSSRYADILLPVNTPWEREGLRVGFEIDEAAARRVQLRQRMVTPRGESRSDNEILFDLAVRLGHAQEFFGGSVEAGWDHLLEPLGLTVAQLRESPQGIDSRADSAERKYARGQDGQVTGFATETRRVEIYSERLLRHGQPALPTFVEPAESPRDAQRTQGGRFPYVLASAKRPQYCHSQQRSVASLRRRATYPCAEISPQLAQRKGVRDGDWLLVSTRAGHGRFVARIVPGLHEETVFADYGWWQACPELGQPGYPVDSGASNFNRLVSADDADPVSGSVAHRSFLCNVELDPARPPHQRGWEGWRGFRVQRVQRECEGVVSLALQAEDGGLLPDYLPGQHVQVRLDAGGTHGIRTRAYSLTGPCDVPGRSSYSIAVTHVRAAGQASAGVVSGFIHRELKVGDRIELMPPGGGFVLPQASPQPIVLVAGGIGITPFMSLLETLAATGGEPPARVERFDRLSANGPGRFDKLSANAPGLLDKLSANIPGRVDRLSVIGPGRFDQISANGALEVWLFWATRNSDSHAFRDRVAQLAARLPRLKVVHHYSAPLARDREGVDFHARGRLEASSIPQELIERRARFYLCGPQGLMDAMSRGLIERGVPAFDLFSERFASPVEAAPADLQPRSVRFARSGITAQWTPDQGTLLQLAELVGARISGGCRVGQCETCVVPVRSGRVAHLGAVELQDIGHCLACQAVPLDDLVLDA